MKGTQVARLLDYLRTHPGASSLEITKALDIVNVTGRISDLRDQGHTIDCRKERGRDRYFLVQRSAVTTGVAVELGL